jgi:hypothetical protein
MECIFLILLFINIYFYFIYYFCYYLFIFILLLFNILFRLSNMFFRKRLVHICQTCHPTRQGILKCAHIYEVTFYVEWETLRNELLCVQPDLQYGDSGAHRM